MSEAAPSTQDSPESVTPQQNQPQTQPAQPSTQPQASNGPGPGAQLLDAINALPERIVHGLREALQPPRQPASQAQQGNQGGSGQSATASSSQQSSGSVESKQGSDSTKDKPTEPGKKTFAQWWFGS